MHIDDDMETTIEWAAGIMDGEGSFTPAWYRKNGTAYPRLKITQGHMAMIERLLTIFPKAKINGPYNRSYFGPEGRREARSVWEFCLSGQAATDATERMWPWLGPIKREQILRVLTSVYE